MNPWDFAQVLGNLSVLFALIFLGRLLRFSKDTSHDRRPTLMGGTPVFRLGQITSCLTKTMKMFGRSRGRHGEVCINFCE
jgi:hypothetical protein